MKISAGIYFKAVRNKLQTTGCKSVIKAYRIPCLVSLIMHYSLLVAVALIASCTTARHEIRTEGVVVASWYGQEFHGRPTASGERFDMYARTCAHKGLPFGTTLKVTHIANGKAVTCVVNDRGPFVPGRDLDLSYGAAREIGLTGPGTARVSLEYLGRNAAYIREVKYSASGGSGPYTIQIGSFREGDNARHLKAGLDMKYKAVYITETTINNTTYYRVRLGKFHKKDAAYGFARTLAEEGYNTLITHYDERA